MTDADAVTYLQNVMAVMTTDGVLSQDEEAFLDQVRVRLGAKKSASKEARSGSVGHVPTFAFPRLSQRIANLEDMVEAAVLDGKLSAEERALLGTAARAAGVSQDQLNQILAEARVRRSAAAPSCPQCGTSLDVVAKFCGSCGSPVDGQRKATILRFIVPEEGIFVTFAKSTAASFPQALELARGAASFQEIQREGKVWYGVHFQRSELTKAATLAAALSSLRNKQVFVDGSEREWHDVFAFAWCAERRTAAFNGVRYCFGLDDGRFNPWGCKQLNLDWTTWAEWFTWGRFVDATTFEFDLERIKHAIESGLEGLRLCPHFRLEFLRAVFRALPRQARIGKEWTYRETFQPDPRAITVRVNRYGVDEKIQVIGVQPTDGETGAEIVAAALKACRQPDVSVSSLRLT